MSGASFLAGKVASQPTGEPEKQSQQEQLATQADEHIHYTSKPVDNLKVGKFQFQNGRLSLKPAEAKAFDDVMAIMREKVPSSRACQVVRKISRDAADQIAAQFLRTRQGASSLGVDTTANNVPSPSPQDHAE